jgi:hypothetical protein
MIWKGKKKFERRNGESVADCQIAPAFLRFSRLLFVASFPLVMMVPAHLGRFPWSIPKLVGRSWNVLRHLLFNKSRHILYRLELGSAVGCCVTK